MSKRKRYGDDGEFDFEEDFGYDTRKRKSDNPFLHPTVLASIITTLGVVLVAVVGAIRGSDNRPLACSINNTIIQGIYNCNGNITVSTQPTQAPLVVTATPLPPVVIVTATLLPSTPPPQMTVIVSTPIQQSPIAPMTNSTGECYCDPGGCDLRSHLSIGETFSPEPRNSTENPYYLALCSRADGKYYWSVKSVSETYSVQSPETGCSFWGYYNTLSCTLSEANRECGEQGSTCGGILQ